MAEQDKLRQFISALRPEFTNVDWTALARKVLVENPQQAWRELPGKLQASRELLSQDIARKPGEPINPELMNQFMGLTGFAPAGITAFHGSPYLFRQFDPKKIGTGEGNQSYGVGAGYTAEARPVAESYRTSGSIGFAEREADKLLFSNKSIDDAIRAAQNELSYVKNNKAPKSTVDEVQGVLNVLQSRKSGAKESGYLYKGDIPDEIIPKFLDWDKPLNQQSKEIQDIAKQLLPKLQTINPEIKLDKMTGEGFYRSYQAYRGNQPDFASEGLSELGIRGIRYLDQGSRGTGKGTSNFIPFRPEDYKVQEINDIPIDEWIRKGLLGP